MFILLNDSFIDNLIKVMVKTNNLSIYKHKVHLFSVCFELKMGFVFEVVIVFITIQGDDRYAPEGEIGYK